MSYHPADRLKYPSERSILQRIDAHRKNGLPLIDERMKFNGGAGMRHEFTRTPQEHEKNLDKKMNS